MAFAANTSSGLAGVSHGTFYNHFENRVEAIRDAASSVANEILSSIVDAIKRSDKEDEAIVSVTHGFMEAAMLRPAWGKTLAATVAMLDATLDPSTEKLEALIDRGYSNDVFRVAPSPLLSMQIRAIQALAISNADTDAHSIEALSETCEAILRLLGRTPTEAKATAKNTVRRRDSTA